MATPSCGRQRDTRAHDPCWGPSTPPYDLPAEVDKRGAMLRCRWALDGKSCGATIASSKRRGYVDANGPSSLNRLNILGSESTSRQSSVRWRFRCFCHSGDPRVSVSVSGSGLHDQGCRLG